MKLEERLISLFATTVLLLGFSSPAKAFSARDVLTYCLTTHTDPTFVRDKLLASGWTQVSARTHDSVETSLAVAYMASGNLSVFGPNSPENWSESWKTNLEYAAGYISQPPEESSALLVDTETSSVILIQWSANAAIRISCLLAVDQSATSPQSYHPRLRAPAPPYAFDTKIEGSELSTSRALAISLTVSVEPAVLKTEVGIETDIVAVFSTSNSYPASSVLP